MPGLFLSRCFFGRKPTTCHVWGRLTIPETEMTWGASWRETNMPSEQPAPSTGHVWARRQVIQHPGFKPPWYQEEQRNAIHTGSWPKRRFMAKTMLLFWKKKYSVFNNWNNLSSASLSHTILYIPHHGSHHPVWPRRFCLLHQKWEILPPNFSYRGLNTHSPWWPKRTTEMKTFYVMNLSSWDPECWGSKIWYLLIQRLTTSTCSDFLAFCWVMALSQELMGASVVTTKHTLHSDPRTRWDRGVRRQRNLKW